MDIISSQLNSLFIGKSTTLRMDAIVTQIRVLAQSADEATRLDIQKALRQVQLDLQDPKEVLMHLANSVWFSFIRIIRL